ncbi:RES family NAD+ phosphorylase [Sphingopyxis sp. JAI128]|uniref:RES family NAD+ phosphorylase n=1 Tax=Sphingopyxis sp. JAI128 TaxID=2723066 RepID=UPI0018371134|nr:RES family NAD+ phosphorylase [Sphingopyxis sp. JAI128]MBB6428040.1 hypothetical protein [Sphingopyxis sp. JAI128]
MTREQLRDLCQTFFVRGSIMAADYGASPLIQFNDMRENELDVEGAINVDIALLHRVVGLGFFHYGPRLWMVGAVEPLRKLRTRRGRQPTINRILRTYPVREITPREIFYRVRKAPAEPSDAAQYDAPPGEFSGSGRLDSPGNSILYGSQDIEICVHECRFSAGDDLYVATLAPTRTLRLVDLTEILEEEGTEFDSLDLAVLMLFLAGSHAYEITRELAASARAKGFDGLIYPSYFSMLRTGGMPFETMFGISLRRMHQTRGYEKAKVIGNLALFGHPVADGMLRVVGINRLVISRVSYGTTFGPVMTPDQS